MNSPQIQCNRCNWIGTESECDERVTREPSEFWGMRETIRTVMDVCPDCGSDEFSEADEEVWNGTEYVRVAHDSKSL